MELVSMATDGDEGGTEGGVTKRRKWQNEEEASPEMMKREQSFTKNQGHKMEIKGVRNIYYLAIQWRKESGRKEKRESVYMGIW